MRNYKITFTFEFESKNSIHDMQNEKVYKNHYNVFFTYSGF